MEAAGSAALRLNRLTDYMHMHYRENISLDDLAEEEGLSTFTVSHLFTKLLGISFRAYLNRLRFTEALRLVEQTDMKVLDISMEAGFSNTRYLNQAFRNVYGCDVKKYRKAQKKPERKSDLLPSGNRQVRYSDERSAELIHEMNWELFT